MDFKTRTHLRACSRRDRADVDASKKYHFEHVHFRMLMASGKFGVCARNKNEPEIRVVYPKKSREEMAELVRARPREDVTFAEELFGMMNLASDNPFLQMMMQNFVQHGENTACRPDLIEERAHFDRVVNCLLQVLNRTTIGTLYLDFCAIKDKDEQAILEALVNNPKIHVKHFQTLGSFLKQLPNRLLDLCDESLEIVSMEGMMDDAVISQLFCKPQLVNAETVQLQCFDSHQFLNAWQFALALNLHVDRWINKSETGTPSPIGTKIVLGSRDPDIFKVFAVKFADSICDYHRVNAPAVLPTEIRIPLDGDGDILLYKTGARGKIVCEVISAEIDAKDHVKNVTLIGDSCHSDEEYDYESD